MLKKAVLTDHAVWDKSLLHADVGYALDSEGHPGEIVTAAPGQDRVHFKVHGKTAHGGLAPEKGNQCDSGCS